MTTSHAVPFDPDDPEVVRTRYWRQLGDGRVECTLCPRRCRMREGQRGMCFVRACRGGEVALTTYGRSSGFCVDPIEKKPLNHFYPGSSVLSFGTAGCNLACRFCQNWDISKSREIHRLTDRATPVRLADAAEQLGCRSIAFTYNDPTIFLEYAVDAAHAARDRGIAAVAVTAGYIEAEPRRELFAAMDAANVDLKAFTERFYRKICGAELGPVLETLEFIRHETDVWLELTTLLIPGENDDPNELERLSSWVHDRLGPDTPLHFTAFHPDWKMLETPPTPASTLTRAREIARAAGLRYVYTGNVHDPVGQSTECAGCGQIVIGRDVYDLTDWRLDAAGRCRACGTPCPGRFDQRPGAWGSRRRPVRLSAVQP